ncbi:hypothetical protein EVJ58_g10650 [Rhodofomes roseus]|uniref:Uncharacterized protein n=1 Tax=Rhodofomes roseus TaxID=34475 RepID=A0A4Y9XPH9_9APHY|nr:hypothetical protein EVJ58_g10650 [Rhodofomes roseus]
MSNFTTLDPSPHTLSVGPPEQDVKPQIDALASAEAQPENDSPSAGKDASPNAIHRCRRCGENVKSVQFHQRTVHQKRCVVVFPDGTKETLVRPADGERFTCTKCSYGHRDPQYLQIHARQKCSAQPPEGGLKPETPRRKRRKTLHVSGSTDTGDESRNTDELTSTKEEGESRAVSQAAVEGPSRPQLEMPSIETIDRPRSPSASPSLSELQLEWAEDFEPSTSAHSASAASTAAKPHRDADESMDLDWPSPPPQSHKAPSASASPAAQTQPPSPAPAGILKLARMPDGRNREPLLAPSGPAAHADVKHPPKPAPAPEHGGHHGALRPRARLPLALPVHRRRRLPSTLPPPSRALPKSHARSPPQARIRGLYLCLSARRPPSTPSSGVFPAPRSPPAHVAQAFLALGYDTDELLDMLARGRPGEGDWDLLEKEIVTEKQWHAWWMLVKDGLRARGARLSH